MYKRGFKIPIAIYYSKQKEYIFKLDLRIRNYILFIIG